jgi:asparagine synthase (glutamine-hydrolysing)
MLIGYFGENPQNPIKLQSLSAKLKDRQVLVTPRFGVIASTTAKPANTTLVGFGGQLLPNGDPTATNRLFAELSRCGTAALSETDGQWALALFEPQTNLLTLAHDHFGAYPLFYILTGDTVWFSTVFRLLLPFSKGDLNLEAVHAYLAFSYVPAPQTLVKGVQAVPPGKFIQLEFQAGWKVRQCEQTKLIEPVSHLGGEKQGAEQLRHEIQQAVNRRLPAREAEIALTLSGGLDSSAVAVALAHSERKVAAFHLDFGAPFDEEKPFAQATAAKLGFALHFIPVQVAKGEGETLLRHVVDAMPQPYGDPVTLPHYLAAKAIAGQGYRLFFNGEGGDQLFAGWANKAMFAAEIFGSTENDRVSSYLQTFHHFYGLEQILYSPKLLAAATDLRPYVTPYLDEPRFESLFDRLRWTNIWMKGSGNIVPRIATLARANGVHQQAPLFDRRLARFALSIPPNLLLQGTTEKYLLKQALQGLLPDEVINRTKRGMGVPATEWCLGPLKPFIKKWLAYAVKKRGLFQKDYINTLLKGEDVPAELRKRRIGEKLWQLAILELWLEINFDG